MDVGGDDAFLRGAGGFLPGARDAFGAQDRLGFLDVAPGLGQGAFAIHHAGVGLLSKLLDELGIYFGHIQKKNWWSRNPSHSSENNQATSSRARIAPFTSPLRISEDGSRAAVECAFAVRGRLDAALADEQARSISARGRSFAASPRFTSRICRRRSKFTKGGRCPAGIGAR